MEPNGSVLCLQETANGPHMNSAHILTPYLFRIPFNIILSIYAYVFQEVSLLQIIGLTSCYAFLIALTHTT
jgi:hypothetical protein